jgi:hypothetical protein
MTLRIEAQDSHGNDRVLGVVRAGNRVELSVSDAKGRTVSCVSVDMVLLGTALERVIGDRLPPLHEPHHIHQAPERKLWAVSPTGISGV